jgi:hypothetical protein
MKRVLPILLSMAGCLLLLSQTPSQKAPLEITSLPQKVSDQIVAAQNKVLDQQDALLKATDASSADAAKKALDNAKATVADLSKQAVPSASATALATPDQKTQLFQTVNTFYTGTAAPLATSASRWETYLVYASLVLGFVSSVFSIFSWNKASAVVSALVVVASGIPKALPIHDRALYYQTLSNQSYSLMMSISLASELTMAEYDDDVRKSQVLEASTEYQPPPDGSSAIGALLRAINASKIGTPACR